MADAFVQNVLPAYHTVHAYQRLFNREQTEDGIEHQL